MPRRVGCLLLALSCLAACGGEPVQWTDDKSVAATSATEAISAAGDTATDPLTALAASLRPPGATCQGSVRLARVGGLVAAVWWAPRADSSAVLSAARSLDGGLHWSAAAPVDTTDRSVAGCHRAAASVAIDSATGYVHVAYALTATEGAGVFFSHSMDSAATFHSPVAILYGDHPGRTSVAASGDEVAVAFEDPNAMTPRVGLALSRTMGHIFEDRLVPVSDDHGVATRPLVALGGRRIAVAWREGTAVAGDTLLRVRAGLLH
jgi:hypothetical protein